MTFLNLNGICNPNFECFILDKNFDFIGDLECVALLISAIDTHSKNAKVVKNACLALASLVEPDGEYKIISVEEGLC